jgi:Flp pilus assembly protein TadG
MSSRPQRHGGITALTALLLIPLIAVLAFTIDLGYIWRADGELQNAADSAALAGASQLLLYAVPASKPSLTASQQLALQAAALAAVRARARTFVGYHTAGDVSLVVNDGDITIGYIADPAQPPSTSAGAWVTGPSAPFPNSVQVIVRRDSTVTTGPLGLFFGRVIGTASSERRASATATLRGQNITGFAGTGGRMLPIGMSQATFQYLQGSNPTPPPGVTLQDNYRVTLPVSGVSPPLNVTPGADGISEVSVYPGTTTPGNFGLLSLTNSNISSATTYANWITAGPSATDLATFGANGIQAPLTMYAGPGLKATEQGPLSSIIGRPSVMPVYDTYTSSGANTMYHIIGFVGATVVAVDLAGANKNVTIQLTPVVDPTATVGSSSGSGIFVYKGISLTR